MADESFPSTAAADVPGQEGRPRSGRPAGGRDSGGFRIRLSDNEMQAALALQEAFGLRSTVAVLGFSLRALAQQLEQGQLDALIAQHRAEAGSRSGGERSERRGERGEGRRDSGRDSGRAGRGGRIDPFARPSRPAAASVAEVEPTAEPADEPADEPSEGGAEAPSDVASTALIEAADVVSDTPAAEATVASTGEEA